MKSRIKSIHGHYSNVFENESRRIIKEFKEQLNIDITYVEATAVAAARSEKTLWTAKESKELISKLRGL